MRFIKILKKSLPLIGIIILIFLIKQADVTRIISILRSVDFKYLLVALCFVPVAFILTVFKWHVLLKKQKLQVPFGRLIKFTLMGQFYGIVTPGRLGNLVRINYLKKSTRKSYGQCSVSVFLDKIIDLLVVLIFALLGVFVFVRYLPSKIIYSNIVFLLFILILVIFIVNQKLNKRWLKLIYKKLVPHKYRESLKLVYHSFYKDFPRYSDVFLVICLSLLTWLILMTGSYFILSSMNIGISWFYLIPALSISTVISLLPISISGWGTREAALIMLFSPFSISVEQILAFSILNFFLFSVLQGLVGAVLAIFEKN